MINDVLPQILWYHVIINKIHLNTNWLDAAGEFKIFKMIKTLNIFFTDFIFWDINNHSICHTTVRLAVCEQIYMYLNTQCVPETEMMITSNSLRSRTPNLHNVHLKANDMSPRKTAQHYRTRCLFVERWICMPLTNGCDVFSSSPCRRSPVPTL